MGTRRHWGLDGLAEGATLTAATVTSDDGVASTAIAVTGTRTATTENAHNGRCAKIAATGNAIWRIPYAAGNTKAAASFYLYTAGVPAEAVSPCGFQTASDTTIATIGLGTDGKMSCNAGAVVGSANIVHGQINRFEFLIDTVAGTFSTRVFAGDSATHYSSMTWTGASFGSLNITGFNMGSLNSATHTGWFDDAQIEEGIATWIGPYAAPLATPVVTISAQTAASGGGSDGTATVTWPAIPGAASYTAHKATGGSPAQGDFAQVAAGVTSPYTFTGLPAGTVSLGIRAKA